VLEIEKKEMVKAMTEETNDSTVSAYLGIAGNKICRKAYPYDPTVTEVPEQYHFLQVEIAVYLLNKRGAEGEAAHSENGISRTYESGDVPPSMLRQIVPMCGVL
jgi:hypothetical protein